MPSKKRVLLNGCVRCPQCSSNAGKPIYKDPSEFGKRANGSFQSYCRKCQALMGRKSYKENHRKRWRPQEMRLDTKLKKQRQKALLMMSGLISDQKDS